MKTGTIAVVVLMLLALPCLAAGSDIAVSHKIEAFLNACMTEHYTTVGMVECNGKAYAMWDDELNSDYKQIMAQFDAKQRRAFRDAQRQWLQYRDAAFAGIGALYGDKSGTLYAIVIGSQRIDIVKARVMQFRSYLNDPGR